MTRKGKIARLPRDIRDDLNRRLENGEAGEPLMTWLNALPEVQSVLAAQFAGVAISKQNLSEWRAGGFAEWQTRQETLTDARELAADAAELEKATEGRLSDHLATVLGARYASALAGWDGQPSEEFRQKLKVLRGMCQDIVELRRGDHSGARLHLERERMEEKREKTEEEVVGQFEEWAKIPAVHDWLCETWVTPRERERRKREIFGLPPLPEDEAVDQVTSEETMAQETEKEKARKMREIFGMVQEEENQESNAAELNKTQSEHGKGNKTNPSATDTNDVVQSDTENNAIQPPESMSETVSSSTESSQVKPSQSKNGSHPPYPPAQPRFSDSRRLGGSRLDDDS